MTGRLASCPQHLAAPGSTWQHLAARFIGRVGAELADTRSKSGLLRRVAAVLALLLLATVADFVNPVPQLAAANKAAPPKVQSRPDVVSAALTARAQGSRVEVISERTDTSTTWANPDGSSTTDQHSGPIRVRDAAGNWQDVDLGLVQDADGSVAPRVHPVGLKLSGPTATAEVSTVAVTTSPVSADASGAVQQRNAATSARQSSAAKGASIKAAQKRVSVGWGWPGKLPRPVMEKVPDQNDKVRYRNVQPGVDLVVQVLRSGYEQYFDIQSAAALTALKENNAGKVSWSLPINTGGLTARLTPAGAVELVDAAGKTSWTYAAPSAWDAGIDRASGERTSTAKVALSLATPRKGLAVVTVTPDQAWITNSARQFPITVDPYAAGSVAPCFDAFVQTDYATTDNSRSTELKVGTYNSGAVKARSYINFPTSSIRGKQIKSASLSLFETHAYSCTAASVYAIRTATLATTATRWGAQPAVTGAATSTSVAKGYSGSCPDARIAIPVTDQVAAWSASTATTQGLRLYASETSSWGWKRFASSESTADPVLTFTYNRKPDLAAAPSFSTTQSAAFAAPGSSSSALYVSAKRPTLSSKASDPDGNAVSVTTEIHSSTTTTTATKVSSCVSPLVVSSAVASCSPAADLPDNRQLYARTAVKDSQGLWNGLWSPWTAFRTAQAAPAAPVITCPYANKTWASAVPTAAVTCTVTGAGSGYTAPGYIAYKRDGASAFTEVKITPSTSAATAKITVTVPNTAGGHSLVAKTLSPARLSSAEASYGFGYGPAALSLPTAAPRVTTTGAVRIAAQGPPRGVAPVPTAVVKWRLAGSVADKFTGWNTAKSAPLTVTDQGTAGISVAGSWLTSAETVDAYADADPVATGVQPTTLNPRVPVLLEVQVCLVYSTGTQCTWPTAPTVGAQVLRVPHAFGNGFPTSEAGPGQVALWTGEFSASATDITVPGYTGDLSISRSHTSFGNSPAATVDATTGIFGPGWTAELDGSEAGLAGLQVLDATRIDGTLDLVDGEGTAMVFGTPSKTRRTTAGLAPGTYQPLDQETILEGVKLVVADTVKSDPAGQTIAGTDGVMDVILTEEDATVTTFAGRATPTATTNATFTPGLVAEQGITGATTYTRDASGRITRILAPTPPGVLCPATGALNSGCRGLRLVYGDGTAGSVPGQVKEIWLDIYDPEKAGGAGMASVKVASYAYDVASKRLLSVTDPRSGLATGYSYDSQNRVTSFTSPGLKPINLGYTAGVDSKLAAVTRERPAGDPTGGIATLASFVYGAPTSGAGLADLSATAVSAWDQAKAPSYAAAVFGPEHPAPSTNPASIGADDWQYADFQYTDAAGYTINTASFGAGSWQIDATTYDERGNVVATWDERATAMLRAASAAGTPLDSTLYATTTVYNQDIRAGGVASGAVLTPAGMLVTDTFGPVRESIGPDGVLAQLRPHTKTSYDQGAPTLLNPATGAPWRLPTTEVTAAFDPATGLDQVISAELTGYDPAGGASATGPTSGWVLGAETSTTTDMDLSGTVTSGDITRRTRFDGEGRTVATSQPASDGADAGTRLTAYFTAAAQPSPNEECGSKPQWAGLVCRVYPAAQPASGPPLLAETTTSLSYLLAPTTVLERAGDVVRTSTSTYLADGRPSGSRVSVQGVPGSVPQKGTQTQYDPVTGLEVGVRQVDASGAPTGAESVMEYDQWGRVVSQTNELGDVTTTGFDAAGRLSRVIDSLGVTSYGFDGTDAAGRVERRGLVTRVSTTRAGMVQTPGNLLSFGGAYDAAGELTVETLPGGLRRSNVLDVAGEVVSSVLSGQVTPVDPVVDSVTGEVSYAAGAPGEAGWLGWSRELDVLGRVSREWIAGGAAVTDGPVALKVDAVQAGADVGEARGFARGFAYDRTGRLVRVEDRVAAETGQLVDPTGLGVMPGVSCRVRSYGFGGAAGLNGARTGSSEAVHTDGDCAGVASLSVSRSFTFDGADRPVAAGVGGADPVGSYSYDGLGRQRVVPAVDAPDPGRGDVTAAYFDSDLPASVSQGGVTTTFTVDVGGRRLVETTEVSSGGASAVSGVSTRHYTDGSDNPSWVVTDPDGAGPVPEASTRFVSGVGGGLAAEVADDGSVRVVVGNLHGDVVTDIDIPAGVDQGVAAVSVGGWSDYTENGVPIDASGGPVGAGGSGGVGSPGGGSGTSSGVDYGWLGVQERATLDAGLILMGARLYNPSTGWFTGPDPVYGGNDTPYTYPTDPINDQDLDGLRRGRVGSGNRGSGYISYGSSGGGCACGRGGYRSASAAGAGVVAYGTSERRSRSSYRGSRAVTGLAARAGSILIVFAHRKKTPSKNAHIQGHRKKGGHSKKEKHQKRGNHSGRTKPRGYKHNK